MLVLLLTSKGAAGIAGAAFVVLAATLAATGTIPVASVALVLGIHRLMSQGLTPTNLIGNAVATIVDREMGEGARHESRLKRQVLDAARPSIPPASAPIPKFASVSRPAPVRTFGISGAPAAPEERRPRL